MTKKDELAELKARVAELERANKPPEPAKPFVPEPYQRYDPTAGMSMPPSALREMVNAVPDSMVRGIVRDNQAPKTPSIAGVPSSQQLTGIRPGGGPVNTTGWRETAPLSNPPGTNWVDAIAIADDVRQRKGKK